MPRRAQLLNSLSRGKVRASWNKFNLFNLYKKGRINFTAKNLYQQKWTAKSETRAYHGEHLTESRFQTIFSSKLESVANLDASLRGENKSITPISLQTYAELEKRLDFALFRAMFASSIRQARQFIIHGYVKVNGIKIRQPGYFLQPGDVFNIVPEKALQALGAPKPPVKQAVKVDNIQISKWNDYVKRAKENPRKLWDDQKEKRQLGKDLNENEQKTIEKKVNEFNSKLESTMIRKQKEFTREKALKDVLLSGITTEEPGHSTFQEKAKLSKSAAEKALKLYIKATSIKAFEPEVIKTLKDPELTKLVSQALDSKIERSEADKKSHSELKQLVSAIQSVHWEDLRKSSVAKKLSSDSNEIPYDPEWAESLKPHPPLDKSVVLEKEHKAKVNLPWQKGLFGRQEPKKPFFTPWKIRPFIAPFAILPSHIEISFETCHAVYLRDPVASPGKSEVITPFDQNVHERAYMWYIRRVKT